MLEVTPEDWAKAVAAMKVVEGFAKAGMTVPDPEELRLMEAEHKAHAVEDLAVDAILDGCINYAERMAYAHEHYAAHNALTAYRERGK